MSTKKSKKIFFFAYFDLKKIKKNKIGLDTPDIVF
jgi:hypothetical protein